jgi:hypothetical protein
MIAFCVRSFKLQREQTVIDWGHFCSCQQEKLNFSSQRAQKSKAKRLLMKIDLKLPSRR